MRIALDLPHLEARMRQSGHLGDSQPLDERLFRSILRERINNLNVELARRDVESFLVDPSTINVWSREFFQAVADQIEIQA